MAHVVTLPLIVIERMAPGGLLHRMSRLVIPYAWHQELLERHLERSDESLAVGRLGFSRSEDGTIEWLVREILPDRSALAASPNRPQLAAFTRSDGSGLTPWLDSNLPALPQSVMVEIFHGIGAFRGKAWGFHREVRSGHIIPLDELVLPGPGMLRVSLRVMAGDTK